jgi:hypothetical protein
VTKTCATRVVSVALAVLSIRKNWTKSRVPRPGDHVLRHRRDPIGGGVARVARPELADVDELQLLLERHGQLLEVQAEQRRDNLHADRGEQQHDNAHNEARAEARRGRVSRGRRRRAFALCSDHGAHSGRIAWRDVTLASSPALRRPRP